MTGPMPYPDGGDKHAPGKQRDTPIITGPELHSAQPPHHRNRRCLHLCFFFEATTGDQGREMPIQRDLCLSVMDMELRHLRAFIAVSEAGTFTAAAKRLLITQPALTRTIQQLERILEVKLIERTSRSVALTQTGRAFRDRAQALLRDLDLATAEARGKRDLRIGFS